MTTKYRINNTFGWTLVEHNPLFCSRRFLSSNGMTFVSISDLDRVNQVVEQTDADPLGLIGFVLTYYDIFEDKPVRVGIVGYDRLACRYCMEDGQDDTVARFANYIETGTWKVEDRGATQTGKAEPAPAIHTESLTPRRGQGVPDVVLAAAVDRGERHVRRTLREWPYGKTLGRRQIDGEELVKLEWFWIESEAV